MENRLDGAFSCRNNQTEAPTTRTRFYYPAKQSSKQLMKRYTDQLKKKTIKKDQYRMSLTHPQKAYYCLGTSKRHGKERTIYCSISKPIHPGPLLMDLLKSLGAGMVVEDHGSMKGVISRIPGISEPYNGETTTIPLGTLNKRYELSDKSTSDRRTHFVLHKYEQLLGLKLTTNTAHNSA